MTVTYLHADLTGLIIGRFYHVYNQLGHGFLERVYENALTIALHKVGLAVEAQKAIRVYFEEEVVGHYFADLVVNDRVLIELEAVDTLTDQHQAQLLNYLKATSYEVGLLLNLGPEPQIVRKIYRNNRK